MKTAELKRLLVQNGARFWKQGRGHERWIGKNGNLFTVPRHRNISDDFAKVILKQANV
jgi:predicted RNA binding protein YcfA (HicA-like mRNA interferase family)